MGSANTPPADRFARYVFPVTECGCWIWTGALHVRDGYGVFSTLDPKMVWGAHRYAWQLRNGPIPDGMHVLHRCDVRCCVNPDHLFLGTHADNMRDKVSKNRQSIARGSRPQLSPGQVLEIRGSNLPLVELGKLYGVTRISIGNIRSGRTWSRLKSEVA